MVYLLPSSPFAKQQTISRPDNQHTTRTASVYTSSWNEKRASLRVTENEWNTT